MLPFADLRARVLLAALAALVLALPACSPPPSPPPRPPHGTCALASSTPAPNTSGDLVFALTSAVIDENDNPDVSHTGFDLDGLASSDVDPLGCTHLDYLSSLDSDQNCTRAEDEQCVETSATCACPSDGQDAGTCLGAVDNQLPTFVSTVAGFLTIRGPDFRRSSRVAMSGGQFIVLVQLLGVDDLNNDPNVRARLFRGFVAPATTCRAPFASGRYQIDRGSLRAGGTTPNDAAVELAGAIVNGRLRVSAGDAAVFRLRWPTVDWVATPPLPLDTHHVSIAMDVSADLGTRGNLGGWVDAEPVIAWFIAADPSGYGRWIRGIAGGLVDIQVSGICDGSAMTPPTYGGISIGFGFDAVRVQLDPVTPVVDAPQPGSCEAAGSADGGHD